MNGTNEFYILLVEDNPDDLDMTLHALQKLNLASHIQIEDDGEEALDFIFCRGTHASRKIEDIPRVVLLDLNLPKMDGLKVLQSIKGDPRTKSVPVIMLTSSMEQADVDESYRLGASSYLVKPADSRQFAETLQKIGLCRLPPGQPPTP